MWLTKVRKFLGWETQEEKSKREYDVQFQAGVARVNSYRQALGIEGEMQFGIPESKVLELWQELGYASIQHPAFGDGMRYRLLGLGYPDPSFSSRAAFFELSGDFPHRVVDKAITAQRENTRLKISLAERNKAFYLLAARADSMTMDEFIREFKIIFRPVDGDDSDTVVTMQQMMYDEAWISLQKKCFSQYSKFANRHKTLDTFFTEIGAGIS